MAEQIDQLTATVETHQKVRIINIISSIFCPVLFAYQPCSCLTITINCMQNLEELQSQYDAQVQQCCDLTNKLDVTEVSYEGVIPFSFLFFFGCVACAY